MHRKSGAGKVEGDDGTPGPQVDDLHAAAARGLWDHHGARAHPGGGQGEVPGEGEGHTLSLPAR